MSRQYSDYERQKIANEEYTKYSETESMEIINDKGEIEYRRERRKLEEDIDTLHRRKTTLEQEKRKG